MGMVIGLKLEKIVEYKDLYVNVWFEIFDQISVCNIWNYMIFLCELENLLFGYWEYYGDDFGVDVVKMVSYLKIKEWWVLIDFCQMLLDSCVDGEWWLMMEEVFYYD